MGLTGRKEESENAAKVLVGWREYLQGVSVIHGVQADAKPLRCSPRLNSAFGGPDGERLGHGEDGIKKYA